MPVDWVEEEGSQGHWLLSARVVSRPLTATLLLAEGPHRIQVNGPALRDVLPGDLVRVWAVIDTDPEELVIPIDPAYPVYLARSVQVVFRPTRQTFVPGTETHRVLTDAMRQRLTLRATVAERVREYLKGQGFLEVETPAIGISPGLDVHLSAFGVLGHMTPTPSGLPTPYGFLVTSPEYHMKRLLVGGIPRCYQFARCFRAGELGRWHQPEFTMLEWYRSWASLDEVLADTERVIRAATTAGPSPEVIVVGDREIPLEEGFDRITVRDAFAAYAPEIADPIALAQEDESEYFRVLSDRVEPRLGEHAPVFLTRFPARHASLAKGCADDPTVCERAELYIAGIELCNAFLELTDPDEQRKRFVRDQREREVRGYPVYPMDGDFLNALAEGMPPSAGNALGFDRLVALIADSTDLGDVIAFPHAPRS